MGSQWSEMGKGLMEIGVVRRSVERCHRALLPKGLDLISIITGSQPDIFDNILHCFVGIAAIQVGLVDLLEELGVRADGMVGHSVGELGCAYADKCLTAEQVVLAAWARGTASNRASLVKGTMAAIGRGYKDMKNCLPEGIEVACHNSETSCTLSGPTDLVTEYVRQLKNQGVFAKLVNVANIAYHSKYIAPAAPLLLEYLKQIIGEPKARSSGWVSSSVPEHSWNSDLARSCSAEYLTNNLLSAVLFEEATRHVPENAICIEIAPHGLLQAVVKRSLTQCTHVPLTNRLRQGCLFTVNALGLLFCNGVDMDVSKLYPAVEYPLPRETNYLHPLITWNHSQDWVLESLERDVEKITRHLRNRGVDLFSHSQEIHFFTQSHRMAGRPIFPPAKLVLKVMEYATVYFKDLLTFSSGYQFDALRFGQPLILNKQSWEMLDIMYQGGTGKFEVMLKNAVLLRGTMLPMAHLPSFVPSHGLLQLINNRDGVFMDENSIYKFLEEQGCTLCQEFRNICEVLISENGFVGKVKWQGCSELYLDGILKMMTVFRSIAEDTLTDIASVDQLVYDPSWVPQQDKDVVVYYDAVLGRLSAEGVSMAVFKTRPFHRLAVKARVEKQVFLPFSDIDSQSEFLEVCLQTVVEAACGQRINIVSVDKSRTLHHVLQSPYFTSLIKSKVQVKLTECKDERDLSDFDGGFYLIVSDSKLSESLVRAIDGCKSSCFVVQTASPSASDTLTDFKTLTPVLHHNFNKNNKMVLYKKTIDLLSEANFIQVPEGYLLEKPTTQEELVESDKTNFFLFRFKNLSDIATLLKANDTYLRIKSSRFVFSDDCQSFNPTRSLWMRELSKDWKVNVCHRGVWGCLRNVCVEIPDGELSASHLPLHTVRCECVDVKAMGLTLQNMVSPSTNDELVVADYCGTDRREDKEVMGVGVLTSDERLETDPVLRWTKPAAWSPAQAATVPLFYSMAYYITGMKLRGECSSSRGEERMLVHAGHSAFSQAVIRVALASNATVYTTCHTLLQKNFITKTFPQLDECHVFLLDGKMKGLSDVIMECTEGEGLSLVVDCLDNADLRQTTMNTLGHDGRYFVLCHGQASSHFEFGMSIFMKQTSVSGVNSEVMLEMGCQDKKRLADLVQRGIERGHVIPLDSVVMDSTTSKQRAKQQLIAVGQSKREGVKVVVTTEPVLHKSLHNNIINCKHLQNRNYMIIGSYNLLWYEMMKWLAVKGGADKIFILTDWNTVPSHIQIRLKNFMKRYRSVTIRFLGLEHLSSPENFCKILQRIGQDLHKMFYIVPGMEKELESVDQGLRKCCKDSWLVCIADNRHSNRIIDTRRMQGFKATSFVLKRDGLTNRSIINILDHSIKECYQEQEALILMDELVEDEGCWKDCWDVLPRTLDELVELGREASSVRGTLSEVSTRSRPLAYAKELDAVIFFPGLKTSATRSFMSRLTYPCFLVTYPVDKLSLNETPSHIAQELRERFDSEMFTLVGEGWAGPLVLQVAGFLEAQGKICSIILLDGSPVTVKQWPAMFRKSDSIIAKALPTLNQRDRVETEDLKNWRDRLVENLMEDDSRFERDEVAKGLDTLTSRLEWLSSLEPSTFTLTSKVHLLTTTRDPVNKQLQVTAINEMCVKACSLHVVESSMGQCLLESNDALRLVKDLVLSEYRHVSTKQSVSDTSTTVIKDFF